MIDERVTPSFWLSEFLRSDTAVRHGLDNMPQMTELQNIRALLAPGMQRVRNTLGHPVIISSGYRSPEVNRAVRGSATSAHTRGLAADFICPGKGPPRAVANFLMERSGEIAFDQLIYEGSWVHVAFAPAGTRPKNEVLTAHFSGGSVSYSRGLA